jgi:hypothetical protein
MISGFRRDGDETCALLGYYTASCGNCLPTFRDNVSVPSSPATYNVDSVLAVCILGTPSSFTLSLSTPLSPWFYPIDS